MTDSDLAKSIRAAVDLALTPRTVRDRCLKFASHHGPLWLRRCAAKQHLRRLWSMGGYRSPEIAFPHLTERDTDG